MEEAQRKNQMLMTQYKAYLKRTSSKMLPAEVVSYNMHMYKCTYVRTHVVASLHAYKQL